MDLELMPELCMLAIFNHLPLLDLIHANEVCFRWFRLQPEALARRRSLAVLVGPGAMEEVKRNSHFAIAHEPNFIDDNGQVAYSLLGINSRGCIRYEDFKMEHAHRLVEILQNLTSMTIVVDLYININEVITLLDSLRTKLINVKLFITDFDTNSIRLLFDSLSNLPEMRSLLFSCGTVNLNRIPNALPTLAQLERQVFIRARVPTPGLVETALSRNLIRLGLDVQSENVDQLLAFPADRAARTTHLYCNVSFSGGLSSFTGIPCLFTNLTSLELVDEPSFADHVPQYLDELSKLPQLVDLTIGLWLTSPNPTPLPRQEEEVAQLKSLKVLTLKLSTNSHALIFSMFLDTAFPNIRLFRCQFNDSKCKLCRIRSFLNYSPNGCKECLKMFLYPLKECANLRKIELSFEANGHRRLESWSPSEL